jgi:hypothetical protein
MAFILGLENQPFVERLGVNSSGILPRTGLPESYLIDSCVGLFDEV